MADYSQNDIMRMQRDATKRVLEMQERAKRRVEGNPQKPPDFSPCEGSVMQQSKNRNFLDLINIKSLLKEQDTTLIAAILLMLSAEDTDPYLLLALLYVLM